MGGTVTAGIDWIEPDERSGKGTLGKYHCRTNIGTAVSRPKTMNRQNPSR
jgi:hypothetical protein